MLNRKGMTLVEVLVALVVLLFVSLALMQTALVSIDANMQDSVRDEAVRVAEQRMGDARGLKWSQLNLHQIEPDTTTPLTLSDCQDEQACICNSADDGCTAGVYDKSFPLEVDRTIRNVTIKFGTRRVVKTLDAVDSEVSIIVRAVYKDKCYSHISTTIVRQPGA